MSPSLRQIMGPPHMAPVYCRTETKQDGRAIHLYGYERPLAPRLPGEDLTQLTGSELRFHPLRGEWAVYAAARQNRTFKPSAAANPLAPSRPGEPLTEIPFEDFELAVFDNRFPSFCAEPGVTAAKKGEQMSVKTASARGACEVIVYDPKPEGSLATLSQERRRLLVTAWIDRYQALFSAGCAYVLPFENRGDAVGVTLRHPHGQIYGFPIVPAPQAAAAQAFATGYDLSKDVENWGPAHRIAEAGDVQAYTPAYARFPYEVWISAVRPISGPWAMDSTEFDGFAALLGDVTARYDAFFECETPVMLTLHAAPRGEDSTFQFSAQFYPLLRAPDRFKYLASVEQATGVFTVDILPDVAADRLRGAL